MGVIAAVHAMVLSPARPTTPVNWSPVASQSPHEAPAYMPNSSVPVQTLVDDRGCFFSFRPIALASVPLVSSAQLSATGVPSSSWYLVAGALGARRVAAGERALL